MLASVNLTMAAEEASTFNAQPSAFGAASGVHLPCQGRLVLMAASPRVMPDVLVISLLGAFKYITLPDLPWALIFTIPSRAPSPCSLLMMVTKRSWFVS